jgi:putative transcriptional regulator
MNSKTIITKRERDGRYMRQTESGWVELDAPKLGPNFPDGEPEYDPENPPATEEQLKLTRRVSPAKFIRWQLGLSQVEFADRYQIPVGTLRDWEQHRSEPDAPAKAYLKVIAADPEGVAEKLGSHAHAAAE